MTEIAEDEEDRFVDIFDMRSYQDRPIAEFRKLVQSRKTQFGVSRSGWPKLREGIINLFKSKFRADRFIQVQTKRGIRYRNLLTGKFIRKPV